MQFDFKPLQIVNAEINRLIEAAIALAPNLLAALLLVLLTWIVAAIGGRVLGKIMDRSHARPSLTDAVVKISRIVIWIAGLMVVCTVLFPSVTPASLIAGLGLGSIAIGLAFKDTFENFLAGFLILLRKPMRIGDDIECEDLTGQVENISIRDTYLRKRSGELIIVPNSYLFKNPVKVITDRPLRRITVEVGISYTDDVDTARDVIRDCIENLSHRDRDKDVDVFATTFNASSIDFMVRWWTDSTPRDEHTARDEAISAIKTALDRADIEIPFPQRTLTFDAALPIAATEQGNAP